MSRRAILCVLCWTGITTPSQLAVAQGQPAPATTVQLPSFGIAIDAQGVVSLKEFNDPDGRLLRERQQAAQARLPADVARASPLR
jgi:hypothetical protein